MTTAVEPEQTLETLHNGSSDEVIGKLRRDLNLRPPNTLITTYNSSPFNDSNAVRDSVVRHRGRDQDS